MDKTDMTEIDERFCDIDINLINLMESCGLIDQCAAIDKQYRILRGECEGKPKQAKRAIAVLVHKALRSVRDVYLKTLEEWLEKSTSM